MRREKSLPLVSSPSRRRKNRPNRPRRAKNATKRLPWAQGPDRSKREENAEEQKDNLLQTNPDKANDQMFDNRNTVSVESHEVLEYPKLAVTLFARELERKSVKELREICRSKGIDTSTTHSRRKRILLVLVLQINSGIYMSIRK